MGDWKGKCDSEVFCFLGREGGGRERERVIKFYFDFAREFLLYV